MLLEQECDIYELCDLKLGKCRLAVAAMKDYTPNINKKLVVATKYVNVAKNYYAKQGQEIDIIKLNGSIELAACLGLADVIVDIVETGATLKENGLEVITEIEPSSARLIANKISFKFKNNKITDIAQKIQAVLMSTHPPSAGV